MADTTFSDDVIDLAAQLGAGGAGENETTKPEESQPSDPISSSTDEGGEAWRGDSRYFQTGDKAGQLKPAFRDGSDKPRALNTTAKMFNPAGTVNPQGRTAGAVMPLPPEAKTKGKGKAKANAAQSESVPDHVAAAAMYNMMLVGACKLISDEYEQTAEMQKATLQSAAEYFETTGISVPPWVGLLSVTLLNAGIAFKTPKGKSKLAKMWDTARAWWLSRR